MADLVKIIAGIESRSLLSPETFEGLDLDALLDQRDEDAFDSAWLKSHQAVEMAWSQSSSSLQENKIDQIRKAAFIAVSAATSHHEIASYVSDDFELIGKALEPGISDEFVSSLSENYLHGRFPV